MNSKRMSWKKPLMVGMVIVLLAIMLAGISMQANAEENPKYTFYMVVHGGIAHPFWRVVERGAMDAAAMLPEVEVIYIGPTSFKFEEFMSMINTAIAAKPDGLLVTVTSWSPLDEPLRAAIKAGIPVIALNAKDPRPEDERIPYLTYIGEDHYTVGQLCAREALKVFTPKRAVAGMHHPGAFNIEERIAGFMDTLKEAGIPVEALAVTDDPTKGAEIVLDYIRGHPDTDLFGTMSDIHGEAFLPRGIEEGLLPTKLKMTVTDISPAVLVGVEEGNILFATDQQQYLQGYLPVHFMYLYVKYGFTPPPLVATGPMLVDKSAVPAIRETTDKGYR